MPTREDGDPPTEGATGDTADTPDVEIEPVTDEPADSNGRASEEAGGGETDDAPETLRGHTRAIIGDGTGRVRLLDSAFGTLAEGDTGEAFELVSDAETVPTAVVVDAELDQRLLDIAAQRGIDHVVAESTGEFVKQPTSVRIRTADQLLAPNEA